MRNSDELTTDILVVVILALFAALSWSLYLNADVLLTSAIHY